MNGADNGLFPGLCKAGLRYALVGLGLMLGWSPLGLAGDIVLQGHGMSVVVHSGDGSYEIMDESMDHPVIHAQIAAEINHQWFRPNDYPRHGVSQTTFADALGEGHQVTFWSAGLSGMPDLAYTIAMYDSEPFGAIKVEIRNHAARTVTVQDIRSVEAVGKRVIDTGKSESSDRVLSDSFGEGWPPLKILNLKQAQAGLFRAAGSQLIYNRQSKESLFFGALTSDKFLTILRLELQPNSSNDPIVASYDVDSTGTTEMQASYPESTLQGGPAKNLIYLSLPVPHDSAISSERLMFSVGSDYYSELNYYGHAIRILHDSRVSGDNLLGWWSWTAFYSNLTQGNTWTNAQWLAQHLESLGYDYFHFDLGYSYARGEYTTPDSARFPQGMWDLTHRICRLGLRIGIWTAPFEVEGRAWVYEHHKDWLVHNAAGEPIPIGPRQEPSQKQLFVLDTTNPGAQQYLRQTYRTLVKQWGAQYFKLDFMDTTAIEGYYYRPNTTALEAQRIGLKIIRNAVGENVLLDKDGSSMLNPVGLVDEGRISTDTGHTFFRSKQAEPGIAARYYMHRNFFVDDPDAFTVSRQLIEERRPIQTPLTMSEAQVSIVLAAVSGGMYEIGDDLPKLGEDPNRVALVENPDLLQMAKLGQAAVPFDLLAYQDADEQPSIFLLREDARQSMLAVFNWTEGPRSHTFLLSDLNFPAQHKYQLYDVLNHLGLVPLNNGTIQFESQPSHSVRLIKILDTSIPAAPPSITANVPALVSSGAEALFSCKTAKDGVPTLDYHWKFGDGVAADGATVTHTYTETGTYKVQLTADGLDGVPSNKNFSIVVSGALSVPSPRRYVEAGN